MKSCFALLLGVFITVGALCLALPNSSDIFTKIKSLMGLSTEQVKRFVVVNGAKFAEYDMINTSKLHKEALSQVKLKDKSVNVKRLKPQMDSALVTVVGVYWEVLGNDFVPVVTSGNDYAWHKSNSKHYKNSALDFRTQDPRIPMKKRKLIADKVRDRLGERYLVLFESPGTGTEHLHVQYNGR